MQNREVPGIIGIRAISSLMICIFHALMATENVEVAKQYPFLSGVVYKFFLAVEIFLAMAGFLAA
jgi:peptidoglycan/LPS O-acetylase OafA/YrhL